jgi:hypothetical protein
VDKRRKDQTVVVSKRLRAVLIFLGLGRPSNMHGRPSKAKAQCPCGVCASDSQEPAQ